MQTPRSLPEYMFYVTMGLALLSWLGLFIAPGKRAVNWWLCGILTPSVMAVVYGYFLIAYWDQPAGVSFGAAYAQRFGSLPGVTGMFSNEGLLLVGWLDILAMDLVGGAWAARRAQRTRMPHLALLPCLLLTYAQAPLGLGLYFIVEAVRGKLQVSDFGRLPSRAVVAR